MSESPRVRWRGVWGLWPALGGVGVHFALREVLNPWLNADSDAFPAFASAAVTSGQTILSVGHQGQGLTLVSRTPVPQGQRLKIAAQGREFDVLLPLAGDFQASNVLVAAGLVLATGEDLEATIAALAHERDVQPPAVIVIGDVVDLQSVLGSPGSAG